MATIVRSRIAAWLNWLYPSSTRTTDSVPTLFDSHLLLPFEDPGTKAALRGLFTSPPETGRFLRNSLLYDRIFVPTVNMLVVILLLTMIGPENLIQSLETGDMTPSWNMRGWPRWLAR